MSEVGDIIYTTATRCETTESHRDLDIEDDLLIITKTVIRRDHKSVMISREEEVFKYDLSSLKIT